MAFGLLMGMATAASAAVEAGNTTLTLSASCNKLDVPDVDVSMWDLSGRVGLGRFMTNNFQLEGLLEGTWAEVSGADDAYQMLLLVRPNFHFSTESATVPYIGAAAGMLLFDMGEDSETSFAYGAQAGIKQFVRENVFLQIEGSFLRTEIEEEDVNLWRIFLGFGLKM